MAAFLTDSRRKRKNDKNGKLCAGSGRGNGLSSYSGDRGNYPLCDRKEEIREPESLIIEKKDYPEVVFEAEEKEGRLKGTAM